MADEYVEVGQLTPALQIQDSAIFPYSQDAGGTQTTFGATMTQVAAKVAEGTTFSNLQTTAKNLVGAINEAAQSGGGSSHTYSTTEQVVGTWIDGRDVYEKTVYNAGGLSGDFFVSHGISNLDRVISCQGSYYDINPGTSGAIGVIPRIENNPFGIITFTSTDIQMRIPTAFGARITEWYFIIRYVKTTT